MIFYKVWWYFATYTFPHSQINQPKLPKSTALVIKWPTCTYSRPLKKQDLRDVLLFLFDFVFVFV